MGVVFTVALCPATPGGPLAVPTLHGRGPRACLRLLGQRSGPRRPRQARPRRPWQLDGARLEPANTHTHTHTARLIAEVGASLTTAEQKYPFAIHHDSEKCHDPPALPQVSGRSAGYESSPSCKVFAAQVIGATVATKRANLKQLHCCRPLPPWKLFPLTLHQ